MGDLPQQRQLVRAGAGRSFLAMRCARLFGAVFLLPFVGSAQTVGATVYPIPAPAGSPQGIASGPDGALWFTGASSVRYGMIGRITTAGMITEYASPTLGGTVSIVAGPDGAMWFTGVNGVYNGIVGRINAAGAITEYTVTAPDYYGHPSSIATGPDGALWFTSFSSLEGVAPIGRITTDGAITMYPGSAYNSLGIAAGPDGALWFTEANANQIGRITTAGFVTEYPIPTAASGPARITAGPDGALWFTEDGANQIGRITPAGVITEYPVPASGAGSQGLLGITTGPDGALWFTAYWGNSIGRAALNVVPVAAGETPSSGSGVTQTFTFQFSHPSGYQNLGVVNVLINSSLDARNACYLAYVTPSSTLYLVNDAGDAGGPFAGQVLLGGAGTVSNTQCAVSLVSAVGSGTILTLTLNIAFQPGSAGNKIAFAAARGLGGGNTGWQAEGVWQVPPAAPGSITVIGMTPPQGSGPPGASQQLQLTLADSKGTSDFGIANLLINENFVDGRNACYLAYVAANNTLSLVDDAGDAGGPFAGAMVLNGQPATIANSQCQLTAPGTSVTFSANTITLTLNITFKAGFAGNQVVYAAGRDIAGGNNTGWQPVGTWTVQ